uniref:Cilia and flagella associated protein 61 n=1 Tax=Latimeria chalumnae TaxID=7897 RepID=H2ZU18_LATCH
LGLRMSELGKTTEVITARRTESLDAHEISKLITPDTENVFGRVNIIYLLEKANLAVTLSNEKNEIVAHAAFLDYPNLDSVDPADWETWLHERYDSSNCTVPKSTLY